MSATNRHFADCLTAAKPVIEKRLAEIQAKKSSGSFVDIHVRPLQLRKDQTHVKVTDDLHLE